MRISDWGSDVCSSDLVFDGVSGGKTDIVLKILDGRIVEREIPPQRANKTRLPTDLERVVFFSLEREEGGVGCQGLESATLASTSHRRIEHITAVEIILPSKRPIETAFLTGRCQLRERTEDLANQSRAKRVPEYARVFLLLRVTAASRKLDLLSQVRIDLGKL